MKRLSSMFLIVVLLVLAVACNPPSTPAPNTQLTKADFAFLKLGMSLDEITTQVGRFPDREVGSGTYIYVYNLADGSAMILGFGTSTSALISATIQSPEGKRETILP